MSHSPPALELSHSNNPVAQDTLKAQNTLNIHQIDKVNNAVNKYYSTAGHHEEKNKKTTGQIKFSVVLWH